jgi:hypothetical protein
MSLKSMSQRIIQFTGLIGLILGILTILRTPTVILPPWFLMVLFLPILLGASFLVGLIVKYLTKSGWSRFTFTSLFIGLFCMAFYVSEYRPTHRIIVKSNFSGQVKLLLAKGEEDDFELNDYGIGYVSKATYQSGFEPVVERSGSDITDEIKDLSFGSMTSASVDGKGIGPYKFLGFKVPGQSPDSLNNDLLDLINNGAIDTTRLLKQ